MQIAREAVWQAVPLTARMLFTCLTVAIILARIESEHHTYWEYESGKGSSNIAYSLGRYLLMCNIN